jgi:hypothetical protein
MTRQNRPSWRVPFDQWAQNMPAHVLACRTKGHKWTDWEETDSARLTRTPRGIRVIQVDCERKCGAHLTEFVDDEGYLARSARRHVDYDSAYLMPTEARSGGGYTREQRAILRYERLERLADRFHDESDLR